MLTQERHLIIENLLKEKQAIRLQDITNATSVSESTIRRDLVRLEEDNKLVRIHGGATLTDRKLHEMTFSEKSVRNLQTKINIAKYAASLIKEGDCIYLDAGSTIIQMIPFLEHKNIVVVTNGLTHVDVLNSHGITSYLLGGRIKTRTSALTGPQAIQSIENYRFDKCFLGVNGFHPSYGYTTPDPDEANIKQVASSLARKTYVLADHSKYEHVSFTKIIDLKDAQLITSQIQPEHLDTLSNHTTIKVVTN